MLFINGSWKEAENGKTFESINPASGEVLGTAADGSRRDSAEAVKAAAAALPGWSEKTAYQRSAYLYKAWEIMMSRKEQLARVMSLEQGKPFKAALGEVVYAADFLLWFAEEAKRLYGEIIQAPRPDQRFLVIHKPLGVVAAITPWNYPISMITRKAAPALAAGCTVVLKAAETTPLCALETFKVFEEAGFPPGVVNLITTSDPVPIGEEFVSNPLVKKISFTGSTEVGRMLASRAAGNMKKIALELGGHAPFIVLEDADPVHAAKGAAMVKFLNMGQACISPNRMYVHRSLYKTFLETFQARAEKMKAGQGIVDGVSLGPLMNEEALGRVDEQVRDALAKGARLLCGGKRLTEGNLAKGFFYAATLLADVTPEMRIYREETFGPVAAVIPFDDEDEVLAMANDTVYGLAAYVYTNNLAKAFKFFEGLDFAIIGINDINPTAAALPFGGMKESGIGREGAREGIMEYLERKSVGLSV
ncbi:MAG: NAD-dependent succinate-semialdehyde dehydrogenase [Spirochaetales bacterium]|nr:NAD-dependent succinate-semialdehyde dehydrogenase [Spirochaetales bacterium]